mgnify:CR=1 FL=1
MFEWYNLTNGSFNGYNFHIAEPKGDKVHGISSSEMKISRRLQISKRPLVDGASVRDFGANERTFSFEVIFFGKYYLENYLQFETAVNTGTPGELVIPTYPRPIQCYFSEASVKSAVDSHNTIVVSVSFVQDEVTDQVGTNSTTKNLSQKELSELIKNKSTIAKSVIEENEFVSAIEAFEDGLTGARRFATTVSNLQEAVRSKIGNLKGQLLSTLALLGEAIPKIESRTDSLEDISSGFLEKEFNRDIVEISSAVELSTDVETVADDDGIETSSEGALGEAEIAVEEVGNINSDVAVEDKLLSISGSLASSSEEMNALASGNAQDVFVAIKDLNSVVYEYKKFFKQKTLQMVLVNREVSLIEVMFKNEVDADQLEQISSYNTHLEDNLIIPPGEVVYL